MTVFGSSCSMLNSSANTVLKVLGFTPTEEVANTRCRGDGLGGQPFRPWHAQHRRGRTGGPLHRVRGPRRRERHAPPRPVSPSWTPDASWSTCCSRRGDRALPGSP
ncbi:hypothetical protein QJS66_12810 [Kocuria rhizophila]|nr:hypothetical protein QJS66_12810 [Kocuria rhizophila]